MINASTTAGREALVYSLVIPIFNEEAVLPLLAPRIVGGIHSEIKRRPLYVVDRLTGFEDALKAEAESRNTKATLQMTRDRRFG
ncbi:hypothetical protein LB542_22620 [Mesorhizobium sp. BR1-1-9]|uniref:hypothetical protein n=1 Tax=unclassified Mesorhizobium TaxID=325217 RepID=UPI001129D6CC|nr:MULTISPECIES: hypothetical protein [unclassified Mesorhizobium]MBZ9807195.1 hypothetical protein [Mesorhizobium sp. ESP-6-2]MBZ9873630.1 hypothetical protein [Mesorhizobium sp. BR1-1-9]MBZ9944566.1 hypothetical protein [Mesorhizobium sp. BR1-1-13]TPM22887.1 hypothetical protein FJ955_27600 [Mesorhizobium sp. B2-2-2]